MIMCFSVLRGGVCFLKGSFLFAAFYVWDMGCTHFYD
jgi:hypothetical protein